MYSGRGKEPRSIRRRAVCKAPDGAADSPGRRSIVLLRNRLRAILPAIGTQRWDQQHAKCTRDRIKAFGASGMEDGDAQHWRPRTLGIDGASAESIRTYIAELDARAVAMSAQLAKDRLAAFRDMVRKAVREAKGRLITGWVGKESAPRSRWYRQPRGST